MPHAPCTDYASEANASVSHGRKFSRSLGFSEYLMAEMTASSSATRIGASVS